MRLTSLLPRLSAPAGAALALLCTLFALPASAHAEDWLARINSDLRLAPGNESVEQKLFPLLIEMDPFPSALNEATRAFGPLGFVFLPRGDARRQALADWSQEPAQQAVIEMIREIGEEFDSHMMSMQLGADEVPAEWVEAGLYIENGRPGLELVGAHFHYLDAMTDQLLVLAYSHGVALAEDDQGDLALEDYARFLALYRLLLDRPFAREKLFAMYIIRLNCEMMTDLAYQYTRPRDNAFTPIGIADALLETDETILQFERFLLPAGDVYKAQQAFDYATFGERRISADRFATMLASTSNRPGLSAFGSAAAFRDMAMMQADRIDFDKQLNDVVADFTRRWNYSDLHDDLLDNRSVARMTDGSRFYILESQLIDKMSLFEKARLELLTRLSGMRCALGSVAFYLDNNNLPGRIVSIQPEYVRTIQSNLDYLNYNDRIEQSEPLRYWVPIRDEQFGARETPTPYPIKVSFIGGMPVLSIDGRPATRQRNLAEAIPFPGFSAQQQDTATTGGSSGGLAGLVGVNGAGAAQAEVNRVMQRFLASGSLPQFGLSASNHAAFEQYLSGEAGDFNFSALRDLLKDRAAAEGMTEMDAQQFSVALAGIQTQGITPDNAAQQVRAQLRGLLDMFSGDAGADPFGADPGMGGADFGGDLAGITAMFGGGDINETLTNAVGQSADQIIDYVARVVEKLAGIPSLRDAITKANRGEFMTSSEAMNVTNDMIDALVTPEVVNPLRDMLVHFKGTELGQMIAAAPVSDGNSTVVYFALSDDSFLLYSVGLDGRDDRAALIEDSGIQGDILFWPPTFSLYREYVNR
ncbi:hypothetical protein ABWH91_02210 [Phycisphaerales bacterium ac7]